MFVNIIMRLDTDDAHAVFLKKVRDMSPQEG